jgi:hypothetical protein
LELDYAAEHLAPPLEPTEDDRLLRNDVTVSRDGGSFGRATLRSGPLSTQAPPSGVGSYPDSVTLSLATDDVLEQHASWMVHLGTVDEPRYPSISLSLLKNPQLIDALTWVDSGARLTVDNPPVWVPPGTISQLVYGYTEVFSQKKWLVTFNTAPASPWDVAVTDDGELGRADTAGSELAAAITTTSQTSISVATTSGPLWTTDPAEMGFDITLGGEVMTVTNITGTSSPQTFTVVRSINGIQKTHPVDTDVRLAQPAIAAL